MSVLCSDRAKGANPSNHIYQPWDSPSRSLSCPITQAGRQQSLPPEGVVNPVSGTLRTRYIVKAQQMIALLWKTHFFFLKVEANLLRQSQSQEGISFSATEIKTGAENCFPRITIYEANFSFRVLMSPPRQPLRGGSGARVQGRGFPRVLGSTADTRCSISV